MPFVQRTVEPKYLSRGVALFREDGTTPKVADGELEAVTNSTLCNALRQLASLALIADDIFRELAGQLSGVHTRCENAKSRIAAVEERVTRFDPKKVPVPVGDICSFAQTKEHYAAKHPLDTNLFGVETRPEALKALYEAATKTPVHAMRQLDRWRRDGHRTSKFFVCTPVLGAKRRRIRGKTNIEIETRMPALVEDLRRWTSDEALGDMTVAPDCATKIASTFSDGDQTDATVVSDEEGLDHKLPSPEEQLQVVALKFPAEIVAVDISGRNFDRMSMQRRSLTTGEVVNRTVDGDGVRRRGRTRRPRNRRRNTLAGTDQKEIENALTLGEETQSASATTPPDARPNPATVPRSKSSDLLRSSGSKRESHEVKISRFNSLKQWGKNQYEKFRNKSNDSSSSSIKNKSALSEDGLDDFNLYETVTMKRRRDLDKERKTHERNSSVSSSETAGGGTLSSMMNIAVKLRESSLQRRQRRQGNKEEPHSSSGNWSASSESGRASIGSEITASTVHPRSTTSAATSSNSLNHPPSSVNSRRRFNFNADTASSVTSEGSTLTPDIIHDLHEDGDSVYSCDTEGYYTSFHMDSGLKTLKEEELPSTPLQSTSAFSNSGSNNTVLSAENEYELFGKGSTSTTTSSAGTVCTTLRAAESNRSLVIGPAVPERKSSLSKLSTSRKGAEEGGNQTGTIKRKPTVVAVIHKSSDGTGGDVSPDSGHNTSSSPIESVSSPNGVRSACSDFEFSESSDMEGPERTERIRVKTTINSSRIPSMCAITPSQSDDESSNSNSSWYNRKLEANNLKNLQETHQRVLFTTTTATDGSTKMSMLNVNSQTGYVTVVQQPEGCLSETLINQTTVQTIRAPSPSGGSVTVRSEETVKPQQPIIKSTLMPLNTMLGKLKTNFTNFTAGRRDRSKSPSTKQPPADDILGEYVTLVDVRNNNQEDDLVNMNLKSVLSGKIRDTEYVSLNELPVSDNNNVIVRAADSSLERKRRQGARVMLDAEGKVVYSSDSLRRRKPPTTFEPGPFVKTSPCASPQLGARTPKPVRPVTLKTPHHQEVAKAQRPMSPTSGNKVIIKASGTAPEIVRSPSAVVQPASPKMRPLNPKGAYVHVQAPGGPLSPKELKEGVTPPTSPGMFGFADNDPYYYPQPYYSPQPFYSTLPSKKSQYFTYDVPPERSVTPDITRGLDRPLLPQELHRASSTSSQHYSAGDDSLLKISPIDPRNSGGGFKASTPSQIKAAENLASKLLSPKRSTMSNEELYAVIHKTKKKLNIEEDGALKRSTVQQPEVTPKRKPLVETGYIGMRSPSRGEYVDYNSEIDKLSPVNPPSCNDRKGAKKTSTLDFKKLLLQKSSSHSGNKKMSAVEQLKLSKQQMEKEKEQNSSMTILDLSASPRSLVNRKIYNPPGSPERGNAKPAMKVLSPRSQWRFANPRTDVLSSTILEDCREDDSSSNASKSSLEKRSNTQEDVAKIRNSHTSVSERISAQRAQFFGAEAQSIAEKPTLETAF